MLSTQEPNQTNQELAPPPPAAFVSAMVEVCFPGQDKPRPYFNDRFDLKVGDGVCVEGEMAGRLGRVQTVSHSFRIKPTHYDRVVSQVNARVLGRLYSYGTYLITFEPGTLSVDQAKGWFGIRADDADYVTGVGSETFEFRDPFTTGVDSATAREASALFQKNKVRFISVDHGQGYAIVDDEGPKEVTFRVNNDEEAGGLTCSCGAVGVCSHRQAVAFQLWDFMPLEEELSEEYQRTGYLAAAPKDYLLPIIVEHTEFGSITLE